MEKPVLIVAGIDSYYAPICGAVLIFACVGAGARNRSPKLEGAFYGFSSRGFGHGFSIENREALSGVSNGIAGGIDWNRAYIVNGPLLGNRFI